MASISQAPQTIACKVHPVDQYLSPALGHRVEVTPVPYGWILEDTGNGYAIIDRGTNYALSIPDESKRPGTNAVLSVYDKGNEFQLWNIMTVMGPSSTILNVGSNLVLRVEEGTEYKVVAQGEPCDHDLASEWVFGPWHKPGK